MATKKPTQKELTDIENEINEITPNDTKAPKIELEKGQIVIFKNSQQAEGEDRPDLYGFYQDATGTDMTLSLWNSVATKTGLNYLSGKAKPLGDMDSTHSISLFVNDEKKPSNNQPDFKGSISLDNKKQLELALWRGHSKEKGKFYMSGTVKDLIHASSFDYSDFDGEMPF